MKNTLLLLLSILIIGGTASFIAWNYTAVNTAEESGDTALDSTEVTAPEPVGVIVIDTEPATTGAEETEEPAATEPVITTTAMPAETAAVTAEFNDGAESEITADEPVAGEDEAFETWRTLAGKTFEARLVWVSKSGKSIRFERPDGSTFVYSTEHLEPQYHEAVHSMVIAKTDAGIQGF